MPNLILDSLKIRNFRAFSDLELPTLGRVNLITGKNNVGKTCLLEALQLYARQAHPFTIKHLLSNRDEASHLRGENASDPLLDMRNLFFGRLDLRQFPQTIEIGPINSEQVIRIGVGVGENLNTPDNKDSYDKNVLDNTAYVVLSGMSGKYVFSLDSYLSAKESAMSFLSIKEIPNTFVWSKGVGSGTVTQWWDNIALTDMEDSVISALQILYPPIERINLINRKEGIAGRMPIVKVSNMSHPVPLRSLGEGINRMFGLILSLTNSGGGMLLVDEVETGLHYSVQADMWRLIFKVAKQLDVQVFATTHSYDCIKAFQKAASEDQNEEAMLIRLQNKNGVIVPTEFDEEELQIATQEDIEVR
ncbi:DNA replication and repair protein RecF [Abditibacteriota bacterium]|nr:DNA replication and repair protein RecF [Abditibacteriota bacterium]